MKKFKVISTLFFVSSFGIIMLNINTNTIKDYDVINKRSNLRDITNNGYIKDISIGENHSAAIISNSLGETELYVWGQNNQGQLGLNNTTEYNIPKKVTFFNEDIKFKNVELGWYGSGVVVEESSGNDNLYIWGSNIYGQVGNGLTAPYYTVPAKTALFTKGEIKDFSLGRYDAGIILEDKFGEDHIFMWGQNSNGQIGSGGQNDATFPREITSQFPNDFTPTNLELGSYHTGITGYDEQGDYHLYMWGKSIQGQVGNGSNDMAVKTPKEISFDSVEVNEIKNLGLGYSDTGVVVVDDSGQEYVYMWGDNGSGQLGTGDDVNQYKKPKKMLTLQEGETAKELSVGAAHTGIVVEDSSNADYVYTWGLNSYGQLGLGNNDPQKVPAKINLNPNINYNLTSLQAGVNNTFAVIKDSSNQDHLFTWGLNDHGQLGEGDGPDEFSPVENDILINNNFSIMTNVEEISNLGLIFKITMSSEVEFDPNKVMVYNSNSVNVGDVSIIEDQTTIGEIESIYTFELKITDFDNSSNQILFWSVDEGETLNQISKETYIFVPDQPDNNGNNKDFTTYYIIGGVSFLVIMIILLITVFLIIKKKKKNLENN